MSTNEALKILGLSGNYTEQDLKKAYYRKAKEYHPDNFMNDKAKLQEAEETMKKINAAYELLSTKENNYNRATSYRSDLENFKLQFIGKLNYYFVEPQDIHDFNFTDILKIDLTISAYSSLINEAYNYEEIIFIYTMFKNDLYNQYDALKCKFYKKNKINESEIIEPVIYDCNFHQFYQQLLYMKEKYSKSHGGRILKKIKNIFQ